MKEKKWRGKELFRFSSQSIYVIRFRRPRPRAKSVNFDFSAKSASTDYKESNKPTAKSLAHVGSEKSLVELGVPKSELFHLFTFFILLKLVFFTLSHE